MKLLLKTSLMKFLKTSLSAFPTFLILCAMSVTDSSAQSQFKVEKKTSNGYTYEYVANDPLGVRKYVLANGLTVYTTVQKDEPRIQTLVCVRAGSKNDPADATGLAHYLEHMLFKGTDKYGTQNYAKEKVLLDEIEQLFETYRGTQDADARARIYHRIDSLSGLAATFAIPGEYDRMVQRCGARGTNAHTSVEETVYENNIPRNQLERWIQLEAERFRNPVLRLFHTELEAVYEEKNRGMDNDGRRVFEELLASVFPKHQYGTQTTIGTVEHLKNPSMRKIREFYSTYYVPNNMAIVLAGDFDPDAAVDRINAAFKAYEPKPVKPFAVAKEDAITAPVVREITGPSAENVTIAFRFPGAAHPDIKLLTMCDMLLSNNSAGIIDIQLAQKQRVLGPSCSPMIMKDYSLHRFSGAPRKGQKPEEVASLLLEQIEELKKGNFTESTMRAVINDLAIAQMKQMESNTNRASLISQTYIHGMDWVETISFINDLRAITKEQIVAFAKKNYGNNYVVVYKRTGENSNTTKVTKPPITPVSVNRDAQSAFAEKLLSIPVEKIAPRFSDFNNDIRRTTLGNGTEVLCVKNTENSLYNLNIVWDYGTKHDRRFATALQYLDFIGAGSRSAEDMRKALYELGCSIRVSASSDAMTVELSGTEENLEPALKLVEERFRTPVADTAALKLLVDGILKQRSNVKKNKTVILQQALMSYVTYGKRNPFTNILSESELRALTAGDLLEVISSLHSLKHSVYYYGTRSPEQLREMLNVVHADSKPVRTLAEPEPYQWQDHSTGKVFFVDFDMVQAEVMMRIKLDEEYSVPTSAFARMYNEYNGGLSGVVFQTIRESKALAYSVEAGFASPRRQGDPYVYSAYIGTQADKLPEALVAMHDVLKDIPKNEASFANAKQSIMEKIEAERFTRFSLLQQYDNLRRLGITRDVREQIYAAIPSMTLADVQRIRDEKVGAKKFALLVVGSKNKLDMKALSNYGPVQELTTAEIFGY